jgi:hypothetical protein
MLHSIIFLRRKKRKEKYQLFCTRKKVNEKLFPHLLDFLLQCFSCFAKISKKRKFLAVNMKEQAHKEMNEEENENLEERRFSLFNFLSNSRTHTHTKMSTLKIFSLRPNKTLLFFFSFFLLLRLLSFIIITLARRLV